MTSSTIRKVEQETLKTFQEEIPSIYFSDKSAVEFNDYSANAENTYRDLFKFPPKMFEGADLIDFGAGTGENTISLARWGANCTLVEMNNKALAIAKEVFSKYAKVGTHQFSCSSIFDYESPLKYDIVHCRGVLSHTADKRGAFKKIATFLKPGGFLIFGDPNKAGGFQNMLQRYAVYRHANTWDEMVTVSELLFKEDIDRSQSFVNRTRRSIIFDRWVIQRQDDPSIAEVMAWFHENDLRCYSAYPPFLMPLIGDSVHHKPKLEASRVEGMSAIAETIWMLQNEGDRQNMEALDDAHGGYAENLAVLTNYVANLSATTQLDLERFDVLADAVDLAFRGLVMLKPLRTRMSEFISEAKHFLHLVDTEDLPTLREFVVSSKHLFRGAVGVRHVDFVAYRPS